MSAEDGRPIGEDGMEEPEPETEEERAHREVQTQINSAVTEVRFLILSMFKHLKFI